MRFVDEVKIYVRGGAGGRGCVAFRREAHVPLGGPAGGDGGHGGNVIFEVDPQLSTLRDFRYQQHYRAERGVNGLGSDCHGRRGTNLVVRVPPGTLVFDHETSERLADLTEPGEQLVAAAGGRGGGGNARFVSSTNRAPRRADPGHPGEERRLRLELKLLADVGLVGLPNAGKSTLIRRISAARPRVADYPFTTLVPNLGVVRLDEERELVVADIPGLIEGAHQGVGLGHRFLRHIERTAVLIYLIDDRHELIGTEGDPLGDLAVLRAELAAHDDCLATKPTLIALNKVDLMPIQRRSELDDKFAEANERMIFLSAATGDGIDELLERAWTLRQDAAKAADEISANGVTPSNTE